MQKNICIAKENEKDRKTLKPIDLMVSIAEVFKKHPWLKCFAKVFFRLIIHYYFADTDWEEIYDQVKRFF